MRRRVCPLLQRLHIFPALSEQLDQWAEWLVRTRFAGRSAEEVAEMLASLATFRDTVLDNAKLRSGDAVADVGAGTGLLTVAAAERVAPDGDVLAVDVSVDALEELRRICFAPNVFYLVGSAEVLPLTNESVDVIVTRSVLVYVRDKAEAAREFFRVLRRGGRLSIFEPINRRNTRLSDAADFGDLHDRVAQWEAGKYAEDDPMIDFDEHDLEQLFVVAGFTDVVGDFRSWKNEISADRLLTAIGAPGHSSLRDDWGQTFAGDEVERLAAALEAQEPFMLDWPQLYLTARKK